MLEYNFLVSPQQVIYTMSPKREAVIRFFLLSNKLKVLLLACILVDVPMSLASFEETVTALSTKCPIKGS